MSRKYKAEMWDRMQFLFRNFYDRMVHLKLCYDGKIDVELLKSAVIFMVEKAPVLHSSFETSDIMNPYWKEQPYSVDDIVSYKCVEDASAAADKFLSEQIPYTNNVQIKVAVFEQNAQSAQDARSVQGMQGAHSVKSVLAVLVNHMCMDGGDYKYFISTLCANYNALKRGNYSALNMKSGSRSHEMVYSKFSGNDLKKARSLY
ncbi:MAG: hypothetical protein K2M36_05855, partial [Clostridia bacterium]|nr:hypothetical protein [Clostridia bacterium]